MSLSDLCAQAIADKDVEVLQYLIDICDKLHDGDQECEGFVPKDLPDDCRYEEMKNTLKNAVRISTLTIGLTGVSNLNEKYLRNDYQESTNVDTLRSIGGYHERRTDLLVIDGIQVEKEISAIPKCLLMKKYDGCSVSCIFEKNGPLFTLIKARTRSDKADCFGKITLVESVHEFREYLTSLCSKLQTVDIHIKDNKVIGNDNDVVEFKLNLAEIKSIAVRGELVLRNKLTDAPNCSAVAGPLNGKLETFKSKLDEFEWIPFEIIYIELMNLDKIVPCQIDAIKLLNMPRSSFIIADIDKSFNFNGLLNTWQSTTPQPLDGIVYCKQTWTYPTNTEESSKRVNYGKYKFKKNDLMISKVLSFDYSIGATGKYTCICNILPVSVNGKSYSNLRVPFRKLEAICDGYLDGNYPKEVIENLTKTKKTKKSKKTKEDVDADAQTDTSVTVPKHFKFGIGSVIEIKLSKDIMMVLNSAIPSECTEEYKLPAKCMFCGHDLKLKRTKLDTVLMCTNENCKGILMKRLEKYLSSLGLKGISETTIFNFFADREFSFKDFYDGVINVPLKRAVKKRGKELPDLKPKFNYKELFDSANNEDLLIAFQLATTTSLQAKMNEYGLSYGTKDIAIFKRMTDPLVKEVMIDL